MKKIFILVLILSSALMSVAQKKLVPVTESAFTGIALPAGSLQDKRMLSVSVANALMDAESKKSGKTVSKTEVFVLPPATSSGFDANKVIDNLTEKGWEISVNEDDNKYAWLQRGNQSVIMYFSMNAKETSLYFALDATSPQNIQQNNTPEIQTATTETSPDQQPAESTSTYKPADFSGQKETFDRITYSPPLDWKKEVSENMISFSFVNNVDKSWCKIGIVKSTTSKGSIGEDLESEWEELAAKPYNITDPPHLSEVTGSDGWQTQTGSGQFIFNNNKAAVILTTFSGYGRCVSIVSTTGNQQYLDDIESFIRHIELNSPAEVQAIKEETNFIPVQQNSANGFAFTTTNFDDGWTSTVQDDWVLVTKGNIKVLIHYPNKQADAYNSVLMDGLKNAWNVLVAPKYSSASNFEFKPLTNWEPIEFAEADMVEKSSGRRVHVVLFKKDYNNGGGKYVEFITPDKTSFEQEFGAYHQGSSGWERMEKMASYNKFAVAASDLSGKWTNDFSGAIQYVNAYTGFDAGMATQASSENFQFGQEQTYNWDLGVASGAVGNIKFQSVKSGGHFSMAGNWQITFSDIEGKARTYDTYFSCIKGLRILWLDNRPFAKSQ
ncbi:MAG: hypothetical protein WC384_22340 [Prolixibacteraceae bacterium]|jgi:hypothetical protein